ncbi:uncharacterized protein LOC106013737 [Aplysia californica]|uniref:Uncharacterized protein LOC106013737 n=1 Tax=Aplysia californica TaxID=6500 RepID=A0ABM1ADR0_APLCA|nr:uncharacterized protein LOC106013737 [Aplysia californica]
MSNQSHPEMDKPAAGILSDEQFVILQSTNAYVGIFFSVLGIGSNFLNIKTFFTMGVDDAVTVSFLGLSISDFVVSLVMFCTGVSVSLHTVELSLGPLFTYDPLIPVAYLKNVIMALYTVTILITLYIAVARCMCVAKPLHFKHVFTKTRSVVIISVFGVFSVGVAMPIFTSMGIADVSGITQNGTRYTMWFDPNQEHVKDAVFFIMMVVIPFATQVIVIVCIVVMTWKLIESSRFRQKSAKSSNNSGGIITQKTTEGQENNTKNNNSNSSNVRLSGRELQAVQQVVLISVIFAIFNTPMIAVSICSLVEPDFDAILGKHRYARLYAACSSSRRVSEQVNSALNFFIYYNYNTKFRVSYVLGNTPKYIQTLIVIAVTQTDYLETVMQNEIGL